MERSETSKHRCVRKPPNQNLFYMFHHLMKHKNHSQTIHANPDMFQKVFGVSSSSHSSLAKQSIHSPDKSIFRLICYLENFDLGFTSTTNFKDAFFGVFIGNQLFKLCDQWNFTFGFEIVDEYSVSVRRLFDRDVCCSMDHEIDLQIQALSAMLKNFFGASCTDWMRSIFVEHLNAYQTIEIPTGFDKIVKVVTIKKVCVHTFMFIKIDNNSNDLEPFPDFILHETLYNRDFFINLFQSFPHSVKDVIKLGLENLYQFPILNNSNRDYFQHANQKRLAAIELLTISNHLSSDVSISRLRNPINCFEKCLKEILRQSPRRRENSMLSSIPHEPIQTKSGFGHKLKNHNVFKNEDWLNSFPIHEPFQMNGHWLMKITAYKEPNEGISILFPLGKSNFDNRDHVVDELVKMSNVNAIFVGNSVIGDDFVFKHTKSKYAMLNFAFEFAVCSLIKRRAMFNWTVEKEIGKIVTVDIPFELFEMIHTRRASEIFKINFVNLKFLIDIVEEEMEFIEIE